MFAVSKLFKRCFSDQEVKMRIGTAIRTIPEEYKTFFISKKVLNESIYDPKLKLFLHLNGTVLMPQSSSVTDDKVLLVEGAREVEKFLTRLRVLMKWGHFYWRLSDLSALRLEPQRVIKLSELTCEDVEMKIHWQIKVNSDAFYIKENVNLRSLLQVQYQRFFPSSTTQVGPPTILYTGISRYVFSGRSGFCTEFHVERIEPKISKSKIEWKWRIACE